MVTVVVTSLTNHGRDVECNWFISVVPRVHVYLRGKYYELPPENEEPSEWDGDVSGTDG